MATPIPTYTSFADIVNGVETGWPDNNSRVITPLVLRSIVLGIAKYYQDYFSYKPEVIPFTTQTEVVIPLTTDRIANYGYVPAPFVYFGNDTIGWTFTAVPWTLDKEPPNTTSITVQVGGADPGIIILK